jgi:hypothetical protein
VATQSAERRIHDRLQEASARQPDPLCERDHEIDIDPLDIDVIYSERLEALAKEVVDQPPEIIGRMKTVIGEL